MVTKALPDWLTGEGVREVGASVWVVWHAETGAFEIVYGDGEGGSLMVPGGEAESLDEAHSLVIESLGA